MDPTLNSLGKFTDPSAWSHVETGVPIFTCHDRYEFVDPKTGKPHEKPVFLYSVDEAKLRRIAANMQQRAAKRNVVPIMTIGHRPTKMPEAMDQTKQPPRAGFPVNPRFDYWTNGKGERIPAVLVDLYYSPDRWGEAKEHPFRSAEYYDGAEIITGLALLKSDPALDMGMTIYQPESEEFNEPCYLYCASALRSDYAMAETQKSGGMPADNHRTEVQDNPVQRQTSKENVDPGPVNRLTGGPEPRADYAGMAATADKKYRKAMKRAKKQAKRFNKFSKLAGYQGVPGGTNAAIPDLVGKGKKNKAPQLDTEKRPDQMQRAETDIAILQVYQLQEKLKQFEDQRVQEYQKRVESDCLRRVQLLESQGVIIRDRPGQPQGSGAKELAQKWAGLPDDAARDAAYEEVAVNYQRIPTDQLQSYIRTETPNGGAPKMVSPDDMIKFDRQAKSLAANHNLRHPNDRMTYAAALEKVMAGEA